MATTIEPVAASVGTEPEQDLAEREAILREHGADGETLPALLAYTNNAFDQSACAAPVAIPLLDEPFVDVWHEYADEAGRQGAIGSLRSRLVQFRFPVRAGMSTDAAYQAAIRTGTVGADDAGGPAFEGTILLALHATAAGRIPVLTTNHRADFELLIQLFTAKNEPAPVPPSMGACMIAGYNNWDRVARLRRAWVAEHGGDESAWAARFRELVPQKSLYQDRFMILSDGDYSGVPAADLGLDASTWRQLSLTIRLEHECAHYFTRHVLGSMRNALHDELIADYCGIVAATDRFHADWLLRFMGLEDFPRVRASGRMQNYRGTPPLSDRALGVIASLLHSAARNVEEFHDRRATADREMAPLERRARSIIALASLGLELLAGDSSCARLDAAFQRARVTPRDRTVSAPA